MKTTKLFAATLIVALAFTACSNDEEVENSRNEVKIVASIGGTDNKTKAAIKDDGSGEFEAGDKITLRYENQAAQIGGGREYKIGSPNLYWDDLTPYYGDPIIFFGWYPDYVYSGSNIHPYKVANSATEAAKDLLMAPKVTVAKGNPVNLQFKHVMHKLTIYLGTNYYSIDVLQNAVITLKNLKSDAKVNFNTCTVDETAAEGTDPYPSVTGSNARFIVAPQTLTTGDEMIEIQIAGKTFTYKVPATLTALESGKHLEITLMLTRYGVELQTSTINAWDDQGSITEEIEIN